MTTPRASYGGGSGSYYPSSSSFPDTPIYDSLVAERGTPQIAPIRVPAAYTPYDSGSYTSYGSGSNLPALPALPALPSGPSAQQQPPQYPQPQQHQQQPGGGYPNAGGYPQPPAPYIPQQQPLPQRPPAPGYNGYPNAGGYPGPGQQPSPAGYEAARPVPPRPVPPRQVPGGHQEEPYQRRNLGLGAQPPQQGGYYQG
ncbi:DUF6643 family protein [Actinacidiphila acididurans]|uniref:Uncharacterized protein n=1 Tax=Actinacidiphila acididurans TaxID=2784346 RepID=A0ABS2TZN9_9ACTN|nr:DUF6643 family protein [Actinacidiphila acididurans]MBM9507428.1 hypothetical protein [Actinacidiphila acididurans]